jgi:hypothetical protein
MGKIRTIGITIVSSIIGLVAILWGSTYSVSDLVEVKYGFPLVWGNHLVNSIAGPVDSWYINWNSLAINLVLWFSVVIIAVAFSGLKD